MERSRQTAAGLGKVLYDLFAAAARRQPGGLSLTARSVLITLERCGPVRLGELAVSEAVTQPSMTATVDQLCQLGLATRLPDPGDGRVVLVSLTSDGARYLDQRRAELQGRVADAIDQLPDDEATALNRALPALRHLIDGLATAPAKADSAGERVGPLRAGRRM
jgi:DNA-binding MarR family transcriptional regulator